jgi:drug/metabolite transporter (DMT)-like permease
VDDDETHSSAWTRTVHSPGILAALGAALLFGASTPFAKALLASVDPWLLAGLLYLGSGIGLAIYRLAQRSSRRFQLTRGEWPWLAGAVAAGGVVAPVLLMFGLTQMAASSASLLLNAEGIFTALLAWFVFHENFDLRIALGMIAIVAGAVVLSWSGGLETPSLSSAIGPSLAVLGACLAWALDNNLTRKVALADATWIACIKGLTAGVTNLMLAFAFTRDPSAPPIASIAAALVVGCLAYGVSLSLFVLSLRHLGTARTGAYFSIAPFFGAALSILLLHEKLTAQLVIAGSLMAIGVWLHLTEHHSHGHAHEALEHEHEHTHDEHHQHEHDSAELLSAQGKHTHRHRHDPLAHEHAHYPDAHHRHYH